MKRTIGTALGTGTLALLLAAGTAIAQGPRGGEGPEGHGRPGMQIMHRVHRLSGLTGQQEEQIDRIVLQLRKDMRAQRKDKAEGRDELRELIKAGASDKEIAAKVEEQAKERVEVAKKHALAMRDVVKILTPVQREELFSQPEDGPGQGRPRQGKRGQGRW